ncbi:MAG: DUF4097 family beta strand repeat-containing protein [Jatrophihabitantaceae bacterium]
MSEFQFPLAGSINLNCRLGSGSLGVHAEAGCREARVSVTPRHSGSDVLQRSTIELHGNTLIVHVPNERGRTALTSIFSPHSEDEVDIVVTVPEGTATEVRFGAAEVNLHGRNGSLDLSGGAGDANVDQIDGEVRLHTGTGDVKISTITGQASVKTGSGQITLGEVNGDLVASVGSGRLELGVARGKVSMKAGSGGAEIGSVEQDVDLSSGSGSMTIGLAAGVPARLNARTGSGRVHTEMPMEEFAPSGQSGIEVKARTGSGNITIRRAVAPVAS